MAASRLTPEGVAAAAPASAPAASGPRAAATQHPTASPSIPFKPDGSLQPQGVGLPAALLVCLLLLAAVVVLLRRGVLPTLTARVRVPRGLQVVETRSLGDRVRVSVLRYRGRELLVAHSDHVVSLLADGPIDTAQEPRP